MSAGRHTVKIYAIGGVIILTLAGALALTGRAYVGAREDLREARVRAEQLDGQLTALQERQARAAAVRAEGEQHRVEVKREADKTDWGAVAVPSGVVGGLCKRARCATEPSLPPSDH